MKKEGETEKREQVHTHNKDIERKKERKARTKRVTSSSGGIRSIGLYVGFHRSFSSQNLSIPHSQIKIL